MRVLVKDVIRATALVAGVSVEDVMGDRKLSMLRRAVAHLSVHRYGHYVTRVALTIGIDRKRVNLLLHEPLVTDASLMELTVKIIREIEHAQNTHRDRCAETLIRGRET